MKKHIKLLFFLIFLIISLNSEIIYETHTENLYTISKNIKKVYINTYKKLWTEYSQKDLFDSWIETEQFIKKIELEKSKNLIIKLAKDKNKIIGFAEFYKTKYPEEIYLDFICIDPNYQHKSIGKNLIFSVFKEFPKITKIITVSGYSNINAQLFFEKIGFKNYCVTIDGITYKYYLNTEDKIKFTKPIKASITFDNYKFINKSGQIFKIKFNKNLENIEEAKGVFAEAFQSLKKDATINDYKNCWLEKCVLFKNLKKLNKNNIIFLSAYKENKMVAFALYYSTSNPEEIYLDYLAVDPEFQGSGLSKELIFSIFKKLPEINTITLCTDEPNIKACSIYRHLGFEELYNIPSSINFELKRKQSQI